MELFAFRRFEEGLVSLIRIFIFAEQSHAFL